MCRLVKNGTGTESLKDVIESSLSSLRILHFSDVGLPDWRIEKSAMSALKFGHEVMFAGGDSKNYQTKTFSKVYEINWTERARRGIPLYWYSVKKQLERVIKEVRPDVVHAHDIFSAKMISESALPFVYDDHEYWTEFSKILAEADETLSEQPKGGLLRKVLRKVARNFLKRHAIRLWTKWEKELVSCCPTITVSDRIAEELKVIGKTDGVFVVPNFPMKSEVKAFEQPRFHRNLSSVYAGREAQGDKTQINRNMDGLAELFNNHYVGDLTFIGCVGQSSGNVTYTGYLLRDAMYMEMSKHSIGLIPFKKHWSHVYINPNKAYEYAHAGLYVMCTSSLKTIQETLKGNCSTFDDYAELAFQLKYFKTNPEDLYNKRLKIFEFARTNLIWEKNEENIFRAYRLA